MDRKKIEIDFILNPFNVKRMNNATAGPQGVDELDEVITKLGALKGKGIDMGRELDVENELKNKQVHIRI